MHADDNRMLDRQKTFILNLDNTSQLSGIGAGKQQLIDKNEKRYHYRIRNIPA